MKTPCNLIVDTNNVTFFIRHSILGKKPLRRSQRKDPFAREAIFKDAINYITKFAVDNQCTGIVIAGEGGNNWRKDFYPDYKNLEHGEDPYFEDTMNAANMIKEFFATCTNAITISVAGTEADDSIAVFVQNSVGVKNIIMSSDRDFVQLLDENTRLWSPSQKIFRTSEDPAYDLYLKCIRGDTNDNVKSSYPRVRETVLKAAWEDPYKMQALMEHILPDGEKVHDKYTFNRKLIDLNEQPVEHRDDILFHIEAGLRDKPNYSEFKVMKYFGAHYLGEQTGFLRYRDKVLSGKVVWRLE